MSDVRERLETMIAEFTARLGAGESVIYLKEHDLPFLRDLLASLPDETETGPCEWDMRRAQVCDNGHACACWMDPPPIVMSSNCCVHGDKYCEPEPVGAGDAIMDELSQLLDSWDNRGRRPWPGTRRCAQRILALASRSPTGDEEVRAYVGRAIYEDMVWKLKRGLGATVRLHPEPEFDGVALILRPDPETPEGSNDG